MAEPRDTTFRSFNKDQGANYAEHRLNYHPKFYQKVLDYHTSNGAKFDTILDIGTGPGIAVRSLALQFSHAIGLDPSNGMIETARSLGGVTSTGEPIRFEVATAEDLGTKLSPPVAEGSIDLITAATAAHWFDMSSFWPQAAKMLKPGGTVAMWTTSSLRTDPSMPNHEQIQAAIDQFEEWLQPYLNDGNRLTRELYKSMPLPWTLPTPVQDFDKATYVRTEYNTGADSVVADELFARPTAPVNLDMLEKILGTSSPMVRWREAHPELVGTEEDLVRRMRREIERVMHAAGVEKGKEMLKGAASGVLLVVKKKA